MAGIYIHIPFCVQACNYCDFHFSTSLKTKNKVISSIIHELVLRKNYLKNDIVETIYFGGGTPSILNPTELAKIIECIFKHYNIFTNPEVTIESNPNDLNKKKIKNLINLGFNRLSLGGQSFNDSQLKTLNRNHSSFDIENSIKIAQELGINNINLDLIYGLPKMSVRDWEEDLNKAISLNVTHLSCYCLTIEKGTVFFNRLKKGTLKVVSDKKKTDQFMLMRNILINANYIHYEISNFCKQNYRSKHNSSYWNSQNYLGVGPSAHSFNGKTRQWNINNNSKYINSIKNNDVFYEEELLTRKNIINEFILTSLRQIEGLSNKKLKEITSHKEYLNIKFQINDLVNRSLISKKNNYYALTEQGMILCDKITSDLFLV
ncbi:MAG: coproporphyrinogen III oxidase [Flavobacteriales bacterium]|nr:coproporphyrinogen III oxidase [Flavobacteriales bacterium]